MQRTCECGCGAEVKRRFKPGHDGRLKGRLLAEAQDPRWWVREAAVIAMITRGWGHFLPMEIVANTPVRNRHHGRFVETRHIDSLVGVVHDEADVDHSHWSCPNITGRGRWADATESTGWRCEVCIHVWDWSEWVGRHRQQVA